MKSSKVKFHLNTADFDRVRRIAEQLQSTSLAARIHTHLVAESALDHLRKFEGRHCTILDSIRKDQERLLSILDSPPMKAMRDAEKHHQAVRDAILATSSLGVHAANRLQDQIRFISHPGINAIADSLAKIEQAAHLYRQLEDTFSLRLVRQLQSKQTTFLDGLKKVREAFEEKSEQLPKTTITYEGMIQLLVAFVFFIYATVASMESEETILEGLKQLETEVLSELQKLESPEQQKTLLCRKEPSEPSR
jgi:hypothetical protein